VGRDPRQSSVISLQAATNLTRLILAVSVPTRLRGGDVGGAGRLTETDGIRAADSARGFWPASSAVENGNPDSQIWYAWPNMTGFCCGRSRALSNHTEAVNHTPVVEFCLELKSPTFSCHRYFRPQNLRVAGPASISKLKAFFMRLALVLSRRELPRLRRDTTGPESSAFKSRCSLGSRPICDRTFSGEAIMVVS
jgi:hypothetical protein